MVPPSPSTYIFTCKNCLIKVPRVWETLCDMYIICQCEGQSSLVKSVFYLGMLALLITSGKSAVEIVSFMLGVNNNFKVTVLYFPVYKSTF